MSWPYEVKQRPVCLHCRKTCGSRVKKWPLEQSKPAEWDGESWYWPYNPFCTLRCALSYARMKATKQMEKTNVLEVRSDR
jgi:hypothetical protein